MFKVNQITNDPLQNQTLILSDGTTLVMDLYFQPQQQGWFINSLEYGSFLVKGLRVVNSFNLLHQFKNKIPFGLACLSDKDLEPMQINDFSSGNSILYILSTEEVRQYAEYLSAK